jgi:hypothetical protein
MKHIKILSFSRFSPQFYLFKCFILSDGKFYSLKVALFSLFKKCVLCAVVCIVPESSYIAYDNLNSYMCLSRSKNFIKLNED